MSMQLGTLGIILTMLLISAPPMAAAFFQGTLGSFMHYSAFGGMDRDGFRNSPGRDGPAGVPARPAGESSFSDTVRTKEMSGFNNLSTTTYAGRTMGNEQEPSRNEIRRST